MICLKDIARPKVKENRYCRRQIMWLRIPLSSLHASKAQSSYLIRVYGGNHPRPASLLTLSRIDELLTMEAWLNCTSLRVISTLKRNVIILLDAH